MENALMKSTILSLFFVSSLASAIDFRDAQKNKLEDYKRNPGECALDQVSVGVRNSGTKTERTCKYGGGFVVGCGSWDPDENFHIGTVDCTPGESGCTGGRYDTEYRVGIARFNGADKNNRSDFSVVGNDFVEARNFGSLWRAQRYFDQLAAEGLCSLTPVQDQSATPRLPL